MMENLKKRFNERGKELRKELGKGLIKLFDKTASMPQEKSPEKKIEPASEPGVETLRKLFADYPDMLDPPIDPKCDMTQLRTAAETACRENDRRIRDKRHRERFKQQLHGNMLRESGMLGVLSTMLKAAENNKPVRWEVYCGYAVEQMQELRGLEEPRIDSAVKAEIVAGMSYEELAELIQRQMRILNGRELDTEYYPLYLKLKEIAFCLPAGDLEAWHRNTRSIVKEGVEKLSPELQEAIREDYPNFGFSTEDV